MQSLPIFELAATLAVAGIIFFIPFVRMEGRRFLIFWISVAFTILLFVCDRVVWANTGFGLIEHATCRAVPSVYACERYGRPESSRVGSEDHSDPGEPPASGEVDDEPKTIVGTWGDEPYPPEFSDPLERIGEFKGEPRTAVNGTWEVVAYYNARASRWERFSKRGCLVVTGYRLEGDELRIWTEFDGIADATSEYLERVSDVTSDALILDGQEQKITVVSKDELIYEDGAKAPLKIYEKRCS